MNVKWKSLGSFIRIQGGILINPFWSFDLCVSLLLLQITIWNEFLLAREFSKRYDAIRFFSGPCFSFLFLLDNITTRRIQINFLLARMFANVDVECPSDSLYTYSLYTNYSILYKLKGKYWTKSFMI